MDKRSGDLPDSSILREWAAELGFRHFGVADAASFDGTTNLQAWLQAGFHGEMSYMARNQDKRAQPGQLVPGTVSALMVGIDYAPGDTDDAWVADAWEHLDGDDDRAYVSHYARGRDYHKLVRRRLQQLANRISDRIGPFGYRAFCDSAPVMEVSLAQRAGLGWRGKHTLLLNRDQGSWFFLGTLYTDLPLLDDNRVEEPVDDHCGSCRACIDVCPTGAIVAPYQLDARRCISYLTIELDEAIPEPLRQPMGNRIYGCDDCQLVCPWNKFAQRTQELDFSARHGLDDASLIDLFGWSEKQFDERMRGSAIRRIGYDKWRRNIAVALGNLADRKPEPSLRARAIELLIQERDGVGAMVREHIDWALARLRS